MKKLVFILIIMLVGGCGAGTNDVLIVVPSFINLNNQTAEKIAKEHEITIEIVEEKYSENVPENSIISQVPNPGDMIKSTRLVSIVLSKGRGKIEMPELTGLSFFEAYKIIQRNNLKLGGIEEVESFSNVVGVVEDQIPAEGTEIGRDTPVTLVVSIGSYSVMPNLIGLTPDEAVSLIGEMGFNGERLRQILISDPTAYTNSPGGYVVRQDPESGMQVDSENPIDIYIKP
jgi:eukaryotic-like serine/threonine-protein kinase